MSGFGGSGSGNGGRSNRAPLAVVNPKLPKFDTLEQEADFMMYSFKVALCTRRRRHAWSACPYAHPGETARRRDPRTHCAIPCPDMKSGMVCPHRDRCPYSHHDFEYWLHPTRYRTVMCNRGGDCTRVLCFFAHSYEELRLTAANRMSATKPGPDADKIDLADPEPAKVDLDEKQAAGGRELKKSIDSDAREDDESTSSTLKQPPPRPVSPKSAVADDLKGTEEQKPKQPEKSNPVKDKGDAGAWVPPRTMIVGRNTSTESLASLKIFSLLANAAKAAKVASVTAAARGESQTSMAGPDNHSSQSRLTRHARSHSLSTAGLDSVYCRAGAVPACVGPALEFQEKSHGGTGSGLEQSNYLSMGEYAPTLERSNSADIATLDQMLRESDFSQSEPLSGPEQKTVAGIPMDANGLPVLPMAMQGSWGLPGDCQYPVGMSVPLSQMPFYTDPQQGVLFGGESMLDIEAWQRADAQLADVSLPELLAGQDASMLDIETLQELQNMYLGQDDIAEVLRGWGVPDSGILGSLGITVPTGETSIGACNPQDVPLSCSASASCVSEDCSIARLGSQDGGSNLQSPVSHK